MTIGSSLTFKRASISSALILLSTITMNISAVEVDTTKSIFITEKAILNQFRLEGENGVLETIAKSQGDFSKSAQVMFDSLMDSSCTGAQDSTFNNLPSQCVFGSLEVDDVSEYQAISLANRFDLAPEDGENCGEYRVTFAPASKPIAAVSLDFLIFEAKLPNPNRSIGLEGCRPVTDFWASLSNENNINVRAQRLHDFYFNGLPGFSPVITAQNYRGESVTPISGQIRLNRRDSIIDEIWRFFEFNTQVNGNSVGIVKTTTKENAFDDLASDNSAFPQQAQAFQAAVVDALSTNGKGLLANTMSRLALDVPPEAETGGRRVSNKTRFGNVAGKVFVGVPGADIFTPSSSELEQNFNQNTSTFASRIQHALTSSGSNLTPAQVLSRVEVLSCGGCHRNEHNLGGGLSLEAPASAIFEMHSLNTEIVGGSTGTTTRIEAENFSDQFGTQAEETGDVLGGGQNIGFMDRGDWLTYNLPEPLEAGAYEFRYRVASMNTHIDGAKFKLESAGGETTFDIINIPRSVGWQDYRTVSRTVTLPAGLTQIALSSLTDAWNINWFEIVSTGGVERFLIKPPLSTVFIPERKEILEAFLNTASCTSPACTDADSDGVFDDADLCPNTAQGANVDTNGCVVPTTGGICSGIIAYPNWAHNDFEGGPNTHMNAGDLMQHNNQLFQANWYASSEPGNDAAWSLVGACQ